MIDVARSRNMIANGSKPEIPRAAVGSSRNEIARSPCDLHDAAHHAIHLVVGELCERLQFEHALVPLSAADQVRDGDLDVV